MSKLFITLYRYFKSHKAVFYIILLGTAAIFAFFATRLRFEENIIDLLPKTKKSEECAVAFGDIRIKDKITLELFSNDSTAAGPEAAAAMDRFLALLNEKDGGRYIDNCFYGFDTDDIMNIVYYAEGALPCHLPASFYDKVDALLEKGAADRLAEEIGSGSFELPEIGSYSIIDGHFFSRDSTIAIAYISPSFSSLDTKAGGEFETVMREAVTQFVRENPGYEVLYHGAAVEGIYNSLQTRKDLILTVGLSLLVICILMLLAFKNKRTLVELLAPVVYGILFAMAGVYFIKGSISIISLGIGAIVMGVAMSYCLHVITHHKFVDDIEAVIREQARPVFLGCLTTIGAFAGLLLTSSELLRDFGIFASLAMVGTTFFALAFLPQFMGEGDTRKNEKVFDIVNKINTYPIDRNKPVIIALSVLGVFCIFMSKNVKFDTDMSNIGYREPSVVMSEKLYNEKVNGGHYCQYYASFAEDLDSAIFYSRLLDTRMDSLQKAGVIYGYSSPGAILVPTAEQEENIAGWKRYWTPGKIDRAYSILKEQSDRNGWAEATGIDIPATFKLMAEADYEPQSLFDSGILPESLLSNFVEQAGEGWLVFSSALLDREKLYEVDDAVADEKHIVVLDPFYYAGDMVEIAHDDFNTVFLISALFVFVVLLLSFRSLVIAIVAFLPMELSWYIVQGLMALFGIDFNIINIMISTFIFGIGVDYSIFVMEGLLNRTRFKSFRLLICHKAAIFFSGVTLLIFTGSLLFAIHPALHSIGACTLMGMTSTILITYSLEPLLFKLAMKSRTVRRRALGENQ